MSSNEIREFNKEVIEEMNKYAGNVALKGINKDKYHMFMHHAFALHDVIKEDELRAMNIIFNYAFAKGIQAERNRLKKA